MNDFVIQDGILIKYNGTDTIVTVPSGVVEIGRNAFTKSSVEEVVLPEGVKIIRSYAFSGSHELRRISFPSTLEKIYSYAFSNCHNLATNHLRIEGTVDVDESAFQGCCKERFCEHSFIVHYHNGEQAGTEIVAAQLFDDQTPMDVLNDALFELVEWKYENVLDEAMDQGFAEMYDDGTYSIEGTGDNIYGSAKEYLSLHRDSIGMYVVDDYTDPSAPNNIYIDVVSILEERIDNQMNSEGWDCDTGSAISGELICFVRDSTWQFGLSSSEKIITDVCEWPVPTIISNHVVWDANGEILVPTIWFGPVGSPPLSRWSITEQTNQEELAFWFPQHPSDTLYDLITDCYDGFIYWYMYECDYDMPIMSEIIDKCPIKFCEDDSDDAIREKVSSFIYKQYLKASSAQ